MCWKWNRWLAPKRGEDNGFGETQMEFYEVLGPLWGLEPPLLSVVCRMTMTSLWCLPSLFLPWTAAPSQRIPNVASMREIPRVYALCLWHKPIYMATQCIIIIINYIIMIIIIVIMIIIIIVIMSIIIYYDCYYYHYYCYLLLLSYIVYYCMIMLLYNEKNLQYLSRPRLEAIKTKQENWLRHTTTCWQVTPCQPGAAGTAKRNYSDCSFPQWLWESKKKSTHVGASFKEINYDKRMTIWLW